MNHEIAVVEYDCLASIGTDLNEAWDHLIHNRSGIRPISRYEPGQETLQGVPWIAYAGQIPFSYEEMAGSPAKFEKWREPCYHALKLLAGRIFSRLAFDISQHRPHRIALLGGTALTSQISRDVLLHTRKADSKFILNQCTNIPLAVVASEYGLQGPCFSISSACASSGHAILTATHQIQVGMTDCALVFGFEFPLTSALVGGLDWISALYRWDNPSDRGYADSGRASRPFSQDRRGFVVSEGAGAVFLCRADYARTMDWPIKGFLRGGYSNSDADHLTRISKQNVAVCMRAALESARCNPEDVDCVNAHGTSTPLGDAAELGGLREVFGDHLEKIPVVANKSQIGHALGAASVLALILAFESLRRGVALPTLNHTPDPSLPAAWIPTEAIEHAHDVTLLNSFGFGGTNVSLLLGRGTH